MGCGAGPGTGGMSLEQSSFLGKIMSFNQNSGFGFISCPETHKLYGRDVFLPKAELGEFWMGDTVLFQVELDPMGGIPKAKHLRPAPGAKGRDAPADADSAPGISGWKNASVPPWEGPLAIRPAGASPSPTRGRPGVPNDEMMLQQMLLEQQQEKEQLMQLQMQVTQVVVQAAMARRQAAEQEAMMQQQLALMTSPDAAQQQQQMLQQQMQQQMQQQQQFLMQQQFMGPCGMGLAGAGALGPSGPNALAAQMALGAPVVPVVPPPDFDMEKRYVGVIKSFNTAKGIGFVDCPEIQEKFGCDVFLHASQIMNDEEVGDVISFTVQLGRLGQPRAKDIQAIGSVHDQEAALNKDPNQIYTGTVKSYNSEKGFGFIVCAETYSQFGSDVFLHKDQVKGINVGDTVKFTLRLSLKGQPQAKDVEKAEPIQRMDIPPEANASPANSQMEPFKPIMGAHAEAPDLHRKVPYTKAAAAAMVVPAPPGGTGAVGCLGGSGVPVPVPVPAPWGGLQSALGGLPQVLPKPPPHVPKVVGAPVVPPPPKAPGSLPLWQGPHTGAA